MVRTRGASFAVRRATCGTFRRSVGHKHFEAKKVFRQTNVFPEIIPFQPAHSSNSKGSEVKQPLNCYFALSTISHSTSVGKIRRGEGVLLRLVIADPFQVRDD